jgi:hypothetical protein
MVVTRAYTLASGAVCSSPKVGAPYDLPVYRKGDRRAGFFFGYGFYRKEVVLLAQAHKPAHGDLQEPKGPRLVHVDVLHLTDEAAPGVEDAPLTEFVLGRTRVLGELKQGELHGVLSLLFGGKKGALLTALHYNSAVRSHQAVRAAGFPLLSLGAEGGTHRLFANSIDYAEAKRGPCTGVRGRVILRWLGSLNSYWESAVSSFSTIFSPSI